MSHPVRLAGDDVLVDVFRNLTIRECCVIQRVCTWFRRAVTLHPRMDTLVWPTAWDLLAQEYCIVENGATSNVPSAYIPPRDRLKSKMPLDSTALLLPCPAAPQADSALVARHLWSCRAQWLLTRYLSIALFDHRESLPAIRSAASSLLNTVRAIEDRVHEVEQRRREARLSAMPSGAVKDAQSLHEPSSDGSVHPRALESVSFIMKMLLRWVSLRLADLSAYIVPGDQAGSLPTVTCVKLGLLEASATALSVGEKVLVVLKALVELRVQLHGQVTLSQRTSSLMSIVSSSSMQRGGVLSPAHAVPRNYQYPGASPQNRSPHFGPIPSPLRRGSDRSNASHIPLHHTGLTHAIQSNDSDSHNAIKRASSTGAAAHGGSTLGVASAYGSPMPSSSPLSAASSRSRAGPAFFPYRLEPDSDGRSEAAGGVGGVVDSSSSDHLALPDGCPAGPSRRDSGVSAAASLRLSHRGGDTDPFPRLTVLCVRLALYGMPKCQGVLQGQLFECVLELVDPEFARVLLRYFLQRVCAYRPSSSSDQTYRRQQQLQRYTEHRLALLGDRMVTIEVLNALCLSCPITSSCLEYRHCPALPIQSMVTESVASLIRAEGGVLAFAMTLTEGCCAYSLQQLRPQNIPRSVSDEAKFSSHAVNPVAEVCAFLSLHHPHLSVRLWAVRQLCSASILQWIRAGSEFLQQGSSDPERDVSVKRSEERALQILQHLIRVVVESAWRLQWFGPHKMIKRLEASMWSKTATTCQETGSAQPFFHHSYGVTALAHLAVKAIQAVQSQLAACGLWTDALVEGLTTALNKRLHTSCSDAMCASMSRDAQRQAETPKQAQDADAASLSLPAGATERRGSSKRPSFMSNISHADSLESLLSDFIIPEQRVTPVTPITPQTPQTPAQMNQPHARTHTYGSANLALDRYQAALGSAADRRPLVLSSGAKGASRDAAQDATDGGLDVSQSLESLPPAVEPGLVASDSTQDVNGHDSNAPLITLPDEEELELSFPLLPPLDDDMEDYDPPPSSTTKPHKQGHVMVSRGLDVPLVPRRGGDDKKQGRAEDPSVAFAGPLDRTQLPPLGRPSKEASAMRRPLPVAVRQVSDERKDYNLSPLQLSAARRAYLSGSLWALWALSELRLSTPKACAEELRRLLPLLENADLRYPAELMCSLTQPHAISGSLLARSHNMRISTSMTSLGSLMSSQVGSVNSISDDAYGINKHAEVKVLDLSRAERDQILNTIKRSCFIGSGTDVRWLLELSQHREQELYDFEDASRSIVSCLRAEFPSSSIDMKISDGFCVTVSTSAEDARLPRGQSAFSVRLSAALPVFVVEITDSLRGTTARVPSLERLLAQHCNATSYNQEWDGVDFVASNLFVAFAAADNISPCHRPVLGLRDLIWGREG